MSGFIVKEGSSGGSDFKAFEGQGSYVARCYRITDLGHQTSTFNGEEKTAHKMLISWELYGDDATMEDGRPFSVSKRYTVSLHEKSQLRPALESWRGRAFTAQELAGFDIGNLLGKPCILTIAQEDGKNGKVYPTIKGISAPMKGMEIPQQVNESFIFKLFPFVQEDFDKLSEGMKKIIMQSTEYRGMQEESKPAPKNGGGDPAFAGFDDDVPF